MKHIKTLIFWKDIPGYEGLYQVNQLGQVKSLPKYRGNTYYEDYIMRGKKDSSGYLHYELRKDGNSKTYSAHRLVAQAFLPNPEELPEVDHINGDRADNRVSNLQWITKTDNVRKSTAATVIKCVETGQIFQSIQEAANWIKRNRTCFTKYFAGKQKTIAGYTWEKISGKWSDK